MGRTICEIILNNNIDICRPEGHPVGFAYAQQGAKIFEPWISCQNPSDAMNYIAKNRKRVKGIGPGVGVADGQRGLDEAVLYRPLHVVWRELDMRDYKYQEVVKKIGSQGRQVA